MIYEEPVKNLPDSYDKRNDSNNYKLLQINKLTTDSISRAVKNVYSALNLGNAAGKALDEIWGSRVNLPRCELPDSKYIIRLRAKMMQNSVNGSFYDLVAALAYTLQCKESDIQIVESDNQNRIIVENIPLDIVYSADFTVDDVIEMIESMLPVGVKIESHKFSGTFEYGEISDTEYTETAGYADLEGTIGGYYGLLN